MILKYFIVTFPMSICVWATKPSLPTRHKLEWLAYVSSHPLTHGLDHLCR